MKLNLVESRGDRNIVMSKASESSVNLVDLLKKYGKVVDCMTEPMVADFYKVTKKCLNQVTNRNGQELSEYGYKVVTGEELNNLRTTMCSLQISSKTRSLRLYPIKSVIVIGMMLTESEVAKKLRKDIIDILFNDNREIKLTRKEQLQLTILNGNELERICALQEYEGVVVEKATKPLLEKIEEDEPKVTFANRVLKSNENVLVRQVAKMASDEGFVIGEKKLYKKLREWGYICNDSTEPTQVGMNRKYFTLKVNVVQTPYGIKSSRTTLVTPRGQIHIVERLIKEMENLKPQLEVLEK